MTARRLDNRGRIDRKSQVSFRWDKRRLQGYQGDTLASALLANNQWIVGRSFKFHRPRGVVSAGVEESGALVTVGSGARRTPNTLATVQEIHNGLESFGQNAWPHVRFDLGGVNNLMARFLAAGFYYKTFMGIPPFEWGRGTRIWMLYEKLIRRAAGMGRMSTEPDPDHYEHGNAHCDLLIVGSGTAGLAAAKAGAEAGLDVWLVEQDFECGGSLLAKPELADRLAADIQHLLSLGVTVKTRTTAFGLYDNGVTGLLERVTDHLPQIPTKTQPRQRFWTLRAKHTLLATGSIERGFAFENNDKPGIMSASAARCYLNRFGVLAGQRIVMATNNDSVYEIAEELVAVGANVSLLDVRELGDLNELVTSARAVGIDVRGRTTLVRAIGRKKITGVQSAIQAGEEWRAQEILSCDLLLVSGGWSPVVNLLSHRGVKPIWNKTLQAFVPPEWKSRQQQTHSANGTMPSNIAVCGSAAGIFSDTLCALSAIEAVGALLNESKRATDKATRLNGTTDNDMRMSGWEAAIQPLYESGTSVSTQVSPAKNMRFVDMQHDVTSSDVYLALQEGFTSVEHLKRYTTLGMATDQGKVGNVVGIALMAKALGCDIDDVGTTTFRPPYTPVSIGAFAGRHTQSHFRALRRTPMHEWNLAAGAVMTDAGLWQRPWYFPLVGESIESAYIREAQTVRRSLGICDVTSLGKIAVQGPDAALFLQRVYTNNFATLPVGKARYGIMLRDDGLVMDDGTTWRLAENDFFMTTTTAHAAKVMVWLEELLQCRWPELRVAVTSVTDQWAGVSIAGPLSREVLTQCLTKEDASSNENENGSALSAEQLPFMGVKDVVLSNGIKGRVARISFSGELAYELYVPAGYAANMMNLIWPLTQAAGGCLYGLEALGTLRIEKGHVTGAELDGNVTLEDAGLGRMVAKDGNYIGAALRHRPALLEEGRAQLVGIVPVSVSDRFNGGSLLFEKSQESGHGEGWVTGVCYSPALGHWTGIGFVSGGVDAWKNKLAVALDPVRHQRTEVKIVSAHQFDPEGTRQNG